MHRAVALDTIYIDITPFIHSTYYKYWLTMAAVVHMQTLLSNVLQYFDLLMFGVVNLIFFELLVVRIYLPITKENEHSR